VGEKVWMVGKEEIHMFQKDITQRHTVNVNDCRWPSLILTATSEHLTKLCRVPYYRVSQEGKRQTLATILLVVPHPNVHFIWHWHTCEHFFLKRKL
jgi:hypothetical protein